MSYDPENIVFGQPFDMGPRDGEIDSENTDTEEVEHTERTDDELQKI